MKASEFFTPEQVKLLSAIQKGERANAEAMLQGGINLNVHGEEGITPLFWLITQKDHKAIQLALELGADPNLSDPGGDSPVTFVAGGNDDELLRLLLKYGGDPNSTDRNGYPALFGAIGHDRWSQIEMLLEYGADLNFTDRSNRTSAHYAAFLNKFEIVHYLIDKGTDYTNRNTAGGDIAWLVHDRLSRNMLDPAFPGYEWALKVKEQLKNKGVQFPPPSPKEIREQRAQQGQ